MLALLKRWDFWFGLLGALGLAFAVFTYIATNKVGRVSYSADTQKVFDPANLSGFTLVNPDKDPVKNPVYATEVVIWNSGDLSLSQSKSQSQSSDRVREPLKISVNGIIYYDIISRINFVQQDNYEIVISADRRSMIVNWKFFDPGQGIRLTMVHSSDGDPGVSFFGRFFETTLHREAHSALRKATDNPHLFLYLGLGLICLGVVIAIVTRSYLIPTFGERSGGRAMSFLNSLIANGFFYFLSSLAALEGVVGVCLYAYIAYFTSAPPV